MKDKIKVGDFVRIANISEGNQWMNDPVRVFDFANPLQQDEAGVHIKHVRKHPDWYEKVEVKGRHLAFYEQCMETGRLVNGTWLVTWRGAKNKNLIAYLRGETKKLIL